MANNCWEVKQCGWEPGGRLASVFGPCPTPVEQRANWIHGGRNAGRSCWAIDGTRCDGRFQGCFASKVGYCTECAFYKKVHREEGSTIVPSLNILRRFR